MLRVVLDTHLGAFHLALAFSAEAASTTVLLGESGAGKSSVLRLLAGLLHPERGHIMLHDVVYFDDERRIAIPPQERPFGYVFQDYVLFPHLNVFENVAFGLRAQHMPGQEVRRRVGAVLEQVRLAGLERRRPEQLSGGQQQRVAIARALVLQPQLLLLDEPLSALDVQTRREVRQELRRILAEAGITTVMVTHHYFEALLFGHQILVLDDGRVIQQGDQRDLREYPRSSYVAELVGVNFFSGHIRRFEDGALCVMELRNEAHPFEIVATLKGEGERERLEVGGEAFVVIEPRHVTLHTDAPGGSARNVLRGRVMHIVDVPDAGSMVRVSLALDDSLQPLTAEISGASVARLGLREEMVVYATFKVGEASAYI